MKLKRTIGGGADSCKVVTKQTKKVGLFTLIMLFLCTVILSCAFLLPKNGKSSLNAFAATDVNPVIQQGQLGFYNRTGGNPSGQPVVNDPTSVSFASDMSSSGSNVSAFVSTLLGSQGVLIYNVRSTLDMDMAFVEFSMNVTVPAGGKVTVKYSFNVDARKAADSWDGSSGFGAELFHFGTGNKTTGQNQVDVTTLSFSTMATSPANSVARVNGGTPTTTFSCTKSGDNGYNSSHSGTVYPNMGSPVSQCAAPSTTSWATSNIVYENDTASDITFKEYFGFMGVASAASGACHLLKAELGVTSDITFEKIAKPAASGSNSQNWDGTAKTFALSGLSTKVALVKATKTALDGTDTTLYEYTNWPASPKAETGTNPITGTNQCAFTDAGKYTLTFRPIGAVWTGTLDSTAVDIIFYVLPKKVNRPTVAAGDASGKTYNGAAQTYSLALSGGLTAANWSTYINIDTTQGGSLPTDVTDNNNGSFTLTDVGDYDVYLTLVDPANMCWNDSSFTTTDWSGPAGGTNLVTLKMKPYEVTVSSLTCDKIENGNWAWNMGDTATVTLTLSDFFLASDTDDTDPDKVNLIYYYCVGTSTTENPVSAKTETYDPTAKTISATIELPSSLAQGNYTFGVKPDENSGAGKNYTVSSTLSKKSFTVSAKGFDPSVLEWTYTIDSASDTTRRIVDGDKLKYVINSGGSATVYNPQIMLITGTYDHTAKVGLGAAGYTGAVNVSAVNASYVTTVALTITDNDTKFINPNSNPNITVSADGKSATIKLNWQIEKGDFDLTGLEWEYWYKDADGNVQTGDYTGALEYNDNRWIYVRLKSSSLPAGLTFNSNYTTVMSGYDTYGDRQKNISTYTTNFQVNDFDYDATSFNAPDATASTLTLNWEIEPKTIVAKFKFTKRNYTNGSGSGSYYIRELDLDAMGVPASYASYFELKYYDSTNAEVTLAAIDAAVDPTNEKTYTVNAVMSGTVPAAANYKIKDASGNTPTATFKTGSSNSPASLTIDGEDGTTPIKVTYDGNPQFGGTLIEVKADDGTVLTANDYDVVYYTGATPIAGNELAAGTLPENVGTYCVEIVLKNGAENTYILVQEYLSVEIEKQKVTVTVDGYDGSAPVELIYDKKAHFDNVSLVGEDGKALTGFTVKYYTGTTPVAANEISGAPTDAGEYCAVVTLTGGANNYELSQDIFVIKIDKVILAVPTVKDITFNNEFVSLADYLTGDSWDNYKDIIKLEGTFDGVKNANTPYTAKLRLTDGNYCWAYGTAGAAPSKLTLTDESYTVSGDDTVATYNWKINPYVLDASNWNLKGKDGAVYNIPANLTNELDVNVNYLYHTDKNGSVLENGTALKAGSTYFVKAELVGADAGNFVFRETSATISDFAQYKVPQSGISAFLGKTWDFLKANWLWFVIALAVLLFLIILICLIKHRKKTKEIREEKKAKKEEEKRRKEEEREERKRKQEAELELQKAKQEAELAKMRAGLGIGMGAAGMAMAQQPMQQAMPTQMPIQQQYQQPAMQPQQSGVTQSDLNAVMQKMETEFAKMRAENATAAPRAAQGGSMDLSMYMLMRLESEVAQLRNQPAQPLPYMPLNGYEALKALPAAGQTGNQSDNAAIAAAAAAAAIAALNAQQSKEQKQVIEAETAATAVDAPTVYPPDAVITTTTTVDTTKAKPEPVSRDSERNFDIDGFYDTFDVNNK